MRNQIEELEQKILFHKELYYQGAPQISDLEYDKLEEKLRALDPSNKVLEMVGAAPIQAKIKHDLKMLSLNKTYDLEELLKWKATHEIVSTLKIDGVSCSLIYDSGSLVLAKTRGDGLFGEDITQKVIWLSSVPRRLSHKSKIEIRGELFCTEDNFVLLAEKMEMLGLEKPTSQRNIVAGLMSRKDHQELAKYLNFMAFDVIGLKQISKEMEKYDFLKEMGFLIPGVSLHFERKTIEEAVEQAKEFMQEGNYQVDGIVFSFNQISLQNELGETSHHPRYKMAFKFAGESAQTEIQEISWSISRNGIFTPVAEVSPVVLSGAKIERVTLHNFGMVKTYNLKKGDVIEIIRSGEVIPKFMGVIKSATGKSSRIQTCPYCNSEVIEKEIRLFCSNNNCPGKNRESILNFIQKVGIEEISGKRLDEMMAKGLVKKIADIYLIKRDEFLTLDKVKDKLADKFHESINHTRELELETVIAGLGIAGGAFNKAQKIVNSGIDTLEKLRSLTIERLIEVESFAEKSATEFIRSFKEKEPIIDELIDAGVVIKNKVKDESLPLHGLSFCITGALTRKRSEIEDEIRRNGGMVTSSVGKNSNFLISNDHDPESSKGKKAKSLNVKVITESDYEKMLKP
jgi:DNA ligase (NAD+)